MKALNCKFKILLMALMLAGTGLYAQDVKKKFSEDFNTNKSSVLVVDTKFSDLTINTWGKDKVVIDVTIEVKNSEKDKAQKLLEQIEVKISKEGDLIIIETEFGDNFSKGVMKVAKKFEISIEANVPEYINLEMETKFGTTTLGSFSGKTEIESSFGALKIEKLAGPEISLEIKQGDCTIGEISNAEIEVSFGKLNVIKADNLDLQVNQGDATIGTVTNLIAEVNMGNCVINMVDPSFEKIDIEMEAGNVSLGINERAGFTLEAEMKIGNLDIPRKMGKLESENSGMNVSFEGQHGDGRSKVILEGKLGNFELKLK